MSFLVVLFGYLCCNNNNKKYNNIMIITKIIIIIPVIISPFDLLVELDSKEKSEAQSCIRKKAGSNSCKKAKESDNVAAISYRFCSN